MTSEIKPEDVKLPEPVAYMTEHEQGSMVWLNEGEALSYTDDDSPLIPLVRADQVRAAVLEATMAERERCAKLCEEFGYPLESVSFFLECAAAIRSGHSVTETKRD